MDMDTEAVVEQLVDMAWDAVAAVQERQSLREAEMRIELLRQRLRETLTVIHQPPAGSA